MIKKENTNEAATKADPRTLVSVTTTTHRFTDDNGAREALEARASLYYDDLCWRIEETHRGKIDRLMGRRKRRA